MLTHTSPPSSDRAWLRVVTDKARCSFTLFQLINLCVKMGTLLWLWQGKRSCYWLSLRCSRRVTGGDELLKWDWDQNLVWVKPHSYMIGLLIWQCFLIQNYSDNTKIWRMYLGSERTRMHHIVTIDMNENGCLSNNKARRNKKDVPPVLTKVTFCGRNFCCIDVIFFCFKEYNCICLQAD